MVSFFEQFLAKSCLFFACLCGSLIDGDGEAVARAMCGPSLPLWNKYLMDANVAWDESLPRLILTVGHSL